MHDDEKNLKTKNMFFFLFGWCVKLGNFLGFPFFRRVLVSCQFGIWIWDILDLIKTSQPLLNQYCHF